mgnify:CR=1 FL=1
MYLKDMILPEYKDENAGRLDLLSVALSLLTVLPVVYGFKKMAAEGFELIQLPPILFGLAIGVVFVKRQKVLEHPMIDLALFRIPAFTASIWPGEYISSCCATLSASGSSRLRS